MNIRKEDIVSYKCKKTEIEGRNYLRPRNNDNIFTNYFLHVCSAFRSVLCNTTLNLVLSLGVKASEQKTQEKILIKIK